MQMKFCLYGFGTKYFAGWGKLEEERGKLNGGALKICGFGLTLFCGG